jgi:hypothetical protein
VSPLLKIIAMLTMVIDHIGVIFFPEQEEWRVIGRIAFPLYAYFIAQGYRYTRDLKTYSSRLLVLALICHIPVLVGMNLDVYNVIFTLFGGLLALILLDLKQTSRWTTSLKILGLTLIALTASIIPIDYGLYGVLTVVMFYYFKELPLLIAYVLLNLVFFATSEIGGLQWFCIFALLFIVWQHKLPSVKVNRTFYWLFYPLHLAALYGLSVLLDSID